MIISPAKKMKTDSSGLPYQDRPSFLPEAEKLKSWIKTLTYEEAKKLWACNDQIAAENYERFKNMDLQRDLSPALLSYNGIQYTYMAPVVFENDQFDYVQEKLRILSGFYGVLKPMDGVRSYRLEMQAKVRMDGYKNLYDFWGDKLYHEVIDESRTIINLASKEYSKCIEKYLKPEDHYITCTFGEMREGRIIQKGVYVKMARGEMVRFMAENDIEDPKELKEFTGSGYEYSEELSTLEEYVFLRRA